ncbi:MAG: amidohydrolase family protein [Pseudomonadota bacterium]
MSSPLTLRPDWLDQVREDIIDPDRRIIDSHHHLWLGGGAFPYTLTELAADTGCGHRIEQTVFLECGAEYRREGPKALRSLGEVEFVADAAAQLAADDNAPSQIAALISHIDLTLGTAAEDIVHQHAEASNGLFRGVRHAGARAEAGAKLAIAGNAPEGLFALPAFRDGVRLLGRLGYGYESWHYHYQLPAFIELAQAVPDTPIVLNHLGTPIINGIYRDRRDEIVEGWQRDMAALARCENVTVKLGGIALSIGGPGWLRRDRPPTSDEFAEAQRFWHLHAIDCFGPERCMFESNFPVDKLTISAPVLWNGFKKIAQDFSEAEKDALFSGTATRVYRI